MDTGTKSTDRKPITSKLVCGDPGYVPCPRGGGAIHGKMWTWQYDKISTGTFVLPGPFPPIFPCRAPPCPEGGRGGWIIPRIPTTLEPCGGVGSHRGLGGGNFHYKGIYRRAAGRGIIFRPRSIKMGIIFTSKVYQWGIFFTQKV